MNTLINLVLAIVLNFLSNGTNQPDLAQFTFNHSVKEAKNQSYQLEDLRSHYLITKEEVNKI
tara:strand:+ start:12139 stop:12324 length:186 start_codon:yes stop_codon:yes gene_type:complete